MPLGYLQGGDDLVLRLHGRKHGSDRRRWRSNPSGKCSQERLTRGTVTSTMRRAEGWMCKVRCWRWLFGNKIPISRVDRVVQFHRRLFFFFTLFTGPRRSLRLTLSDTRVYESHIRARFGTTAHADRVVQMHRRRCDRYRKVDVRLPGKGNSNYHGARPVHLIITMIK